MSPRTPKTRFHVNMKTGKVGKCDATLRACPLGGAEIHFDTRQDAAKAYELARSHATVAPLTKKKSTVQTEPEEAAGAQNSEIITYLENASNAGEIQRGLDMLDNQRDNLPPKDVNWYGYKLIIESPHATSLQKDVATDAIGIYGLSRWTPLSDRVDNPAFGVDGFKPRDWIGWNRQGRSNSLLPDNAIPTKSLRAGDQFVREGDEEKTVFTTERLTLDGIKTDKGFLRLGEHGHIGCVYLVEAA